MNGGKEARTRGLMAKKLEVSTFILETKRAAREKKERIFKVAIS